MIAHGISGHAEILKTGSAQDTIAATLQPCSISLGVMRDQGVEMLSKTGSGRPGKQIGKA